MNVKLQRLVPGTVRTVQYSEVGRCPLTKQRTIKLISCKPKYAIIAYRTPLLVVGYVCLLREVRANNTAGKSKVDLKI